MSALSEGFKEGVDYTIERNYGYAHMAFTFVALNARTRCLTIQEVAQIADSIYPAFGGRNFCHNSQTGTYTGIIHTD